MNKQLLASLVLAGTVSTTLAQVTVDYGINGNIAGNAPSPNILPINLDAGGLASIDGSYVTGVNTNPVVGISGTATGIGSVSLDVVAASGSWSAGSFTPGSQFRVAGIGGLGVGNNYVDEGEAIQFSADLTGLPAGYTLSVASISFEDPQVAEATVVGNDGGSTSFSGFAQGDSLSLGGLQTSLASGSSGVLFTVYGGTGAKWKYDDLVFDIVVPEPSTFALVGLGLATLLTFRRRR